MKFQFNNNKFQIHFQNGSTVSVIRTKNQPHYVSAIVYTEENQTKFDNLNPIVLVHLLTHVSNNTQFPLSQYEINKIVADTSTVFFEFTEEMFMITVANNDKVGIARIDPNKVKITLTKIQDGASFTPDKLLGSEELVIFLNNIIVNSTVKQPMSSTKRSKKVEQSPFYKIIDEYSHVHGQTEYLNDANLLAFAIHNRNNIKLYVVKDQITYSVIEDNDIKSPVYTEMKQTLIKDIELLGTCQIA